MRMVKYTRVFISSGRNDLIYSDHVFGCFPCLIFICLDGLGFTKGVRLRMNSASGWFIQGLQTCSGTIFFQKKSPHRSGCSHPAAVRASVHKHRSHKISLTCVRVHHVRSSRSAEAVAVQANHRAGYVQVCCEKHSECRTSRSQNWKKKKKKTSSISKSLGFPLSFSKN